MRWSKACAGVVVAVGLGTTTTLVSGGSATAAPQFGQRHVATGPQSIRIAIPMYAVAHQAKGISQPSISITSNCGTAFLYVSRVSEYVAEAHVDFGFQNLAHPAIWVTAHTSMVNVDGPGTATASWNQAAPYTSSWEKQTNLYSSHQVSGIYQVTAYIHTTGVVYDCYSSPSLYTDIYLYRG